MSLRIILLGGQSPSSRIVYNSLQSEFDVSAAIIEERVARIDLMRRRVKKLGWTCVAGQIAFAQIIVPVLQRRSKPRQDEIKQEYGLDDSPIDEAKITRVASVNSDECIRALDRRQPDIVVLAGTRIVSERVLISTNATFLNIHAGITPLYRGVHGGYWAMANNDKSHCGVTVHLVDKGIDTGGILQQSKIEPHAKDNFATYPLLQLGEGTKLLKLAIREIQAKTFCIKTAPEGPSRIWSHPTVRQYLQNRLAGVK